MMRIMRKRDLKEEVRKQEGDNCCSCDIGDGVALLLVVLQMDSSHGGR